MSKLKANKQAFMTQTKISKLVVILAIPAMISMLITSIYNMADTYFVGLIGDGVVGTSAVSVVFSYMSIMQAMGFFFGHGSGNYISKKLGKGDNKSANEMASVGFFSSFILGLVFLVFGIIFLEPFAKLLQANPENMQDVKSYLFYILLGSPFIMTSFVLNNQLRFQGSAYYGMIGIGVGALLNIALDPLLIFGLNMGVGGAGLATSQSQIVSFLILFIMCNKDGNIKVSFKTFKPSWKKYKQIIIGGTPSFIRQGFASVSVMVLSDVAYAVGGNELVAGMGVGARIMFFIFSVLLGLGQGFQPICGYNYGAKRYDRVLQAYRFTILSSTLIVVVFSIICFIFAPQFARLINSDPTVYNIAGTSLRFQFVMFISMPFVVATNMMLQNLGRVVGASLLSTIRQGVVYIPALYLFYALSMGQIGVFLAQPIADFIALIVSIPYAIKEVKRLLIKIKEQRTEQNSLKIVGDKQ